MKLSSRKDVTLHSFSFINLHCAYRYLNLHHSPYHTFFIIPLFVNFSCKFGINATIFVGPSKITGILVSLKYRPSLRYLQAMYGAESAGRLYDEPPTPPVLKNRSPNGTAFCLKPGPSSCRHNGCWICHEHCRSKPRRLFLCR